MNILGRYYQIQASKGINRILSTLLLPIKAQNQWRLHLAKKQKRVNVINGIGLYQRPLLASYSRSGTNWIRYIVEYISGCPTPGQKRLISGNNYYIDRAHRAYPVMKFYKKVVLIIRDYRECILRHHKDIWSDYPNVVALLTDAELEQPTSWYIKNIEAFDAFQGEKLLIYYEELLEKPEETIMELSAFLGLDQKKTKLFLEDIDVHFQYSVNVYTREGHCSETSSTKDVRFHAETKLTPDQVKEFDEFYFSRYPDLSNKYLLRYNTRNQQP
ncbi:MAG: hypothetical protein ACE5KZ_15610 [Candidatus Scalinduaceae bacterium]